MSKSPEFLRCLQSLGAQTIIEKLSPYLTDERRERILPVIDNRIKSIQCAVEAPSDIHNALAMVRTAEALGLTEAHLIGEPRKGKGRQTMRGSDRWMNLHSHESLDDFQEAMKGIAIYGATPRGDAVLEELPLDRPCCFLFGNEKKGLTDAALELCDTRFTIPMYGFCESFNLSVAAAITLYSAVNRKRDLIDASGDLSETEKQTEVAWFYYKSTGNRLANQILI